MGKSHYIQVKELVLDAIEPSVLGPLCEAEGYVDVSDSEVLAPLCEAEGYIDPTDSEALAVVCPANGYFPDPNVPYVPPVELETTSDEEILLLVDNGAERLIAFSALVNVGNVTVELMDLTYNVLDTTSASGLNRKIYLPSGATSYYLLRLTPTTVGSYFTSFTTNITVTGYVKQFRIYAATFKTPSLNSLYNAFSYAQTLEQCLFETTMPLLTTIGYAFSKTNMRNFTFPENLVLLNSISRVFGESALITVDFNSNTFPALTTGSYAFIASDIESCDISMFAPTAGFSANGMFQNCISIESITLPETLKATNLGSFCYGCVKLTELIMPINPLNDLTSSSGLTSFAPYCPIENNILFPEIGTGLTGYSRTMFYYNKFKKLEFQGSYYGTELSTVVAYSTTVEEVIFPVMPNITNWNSCFRDCSSIKTIELKGETIASTSLTIGSTTGLYIPRSILSISGTFSNPNMYVQIALTYANNLTTLSLPNLRPSTVYIGNTGDGFAENLTSINIDWAEWDGSYIYLYANLDSTELDRIMTLLPTVTGKTLKISNCTGYATCDTTIATNKGWTVT